jgi:putative tryptophan/tyrosine transport system substrate-binding protein
MRRRSFLSLLGGAAAVWPAAARAQQRRIPARIGYLSPNLAPSPNQLEAFRRGMNDLGWVEGRTFVIDFRDAQGKSERLPALAAELAALGPDVIVAPTTLPALAAARASQTIPIVFPIASDPVGSGLITSLARPGGNITGFSLLTADLAGKCLDLLVQAVPKASSVAVLWQPSAHPDSTDKALLRQVETVGQGLGRRLHFVEARGVEDFEGAFSKMTMLGADALTVLTASLFNQHRKRVVDLAATNRLPAIYSLRESVDAGGLMSYGPNLVDMFRRSAAYVDRILKGTNPSDLAVEQPTKFEMVLNLRTAKALGLTIPPLVLAQIDEVIE